VARSRTSRGVSVGGLRSLVLDDATAAKAPEASQLPPTSFGSLSGRAQLDERVLRWLNERERFDRRKRSRDERPEGGDVASSTSGTAP